MLWEPRGKIQRDCTGLGRTRQAIRRMQDTYQAKGRRGGKAGSKAFHREELGTLSSQQGGLL